MFGRPKRKNPEAVEAEFRKEYEKSEGVEKKDILAMVISAMLVILPVCTLVIVGLCALCMGMFGLF